MKLTIEELELIQKCAECNGDELTVYEDYSGRGMFGDTTTGLVVNDDSDFNDLIDVVTEISPNLGRKLEKAKCDALGFKIIYY